MVSHQLKHERNGILIFCDYCTSRVKTFNTKFRLMMHIHEIHPEKRSEMRILAREAERRAREAERRARREAAIQKQKEEFEKAQAQLMAMPGGSWKKGVDSNRTFYTFVPNLVFTLTKWPPNQEPLPDIASYFTN
uniref:C2H2-type domain-containing protein n=1 Tax=Caenorhabditis tropicalis TaxID=1561998 RepID=A0A1I7TSP9_9PELO